MSECKMDAKYKCIHSYMASNGLCFMVTWDYFQKNHLLEVGLAFVYEGMVTYDFTLHNFGSVV